MYLRASIAVSIAALLVTCLIPQMADEGGQGALVDSFKSGEYTKSKVFGSAGEDTDTFTFDIERDANVTLASFSVQGEDGGSGNYPRNLTINLDGKGELEYRFGGKGYGDLGHQYMFNTSDVEVQVQFTHPNGGAEAHILLPKDADVTSTSMVVEGKGGNVGPFDAYIAYADLGDYGVVSYLNSDSRFRTVTGQDVRATTPSLATLQNYDVVVTWTNIHYSNPSAMGDVLKSFVDEGGGVVVCCYAHHASTWGPTGSWLQNNYDPILQTDSYTSGATSIGNVMMPAHPLMTGVTSVSPASYFTTSTLSTGSTGIFNWSNGFIGAAVKTVGLGAVAGLNQYPGLDSGASCDLLIANAAAWAAGAGCKFVPENATLDVGKHGGTPDWKHQGKLEDKVTVTGFEDSLNDYLGIHGANFADDFGNKFCKVPLNFTSDTPGAIKLSKLSITYGYEATVSEHPGPGNLASSVNEILLNTVPGPGNVTIAIHVGVDSPGKVTISDLAMVYDAAPVFREIDLLRVPEDSLVRHLIDLAKYCVDDFDDPVNLTYSVVSNSLSGHVGVYVADGHYLAVDATVDRDWNSASGDGGVVNVKINAKDLGGNTGASGLIPIEVTPVNDEPRPHEQIPDIIIWEDTEEEELSLAAHSYFFDVESDILHYDVIVDPLGVYQGEEGNLTASIKGMNNALEITAQGDFNTGEDAAVPVWVFSDDDTQVNTNADGYLPNGRHNWTFQEINVTVLNVNDAPVWSQIPTVHLEEDGALEDAFNVEDYVTDVDDPVDELRFTIVDNPNSTQLNANIDEGHFVDLKARQKNWTGDVTIKIRATDRGENSGDGNIHIVIDPVNDFPAVTLVSPPEGAILASDVVALQWEGVDAETPSEELTYSVFLGEQTPDTLIAERLTRMSYEVKVEDGHTYHWTVSASDGSGNGTKAQARAFSVDFGTGQDYGISMRLSRASLSVGAGGFEEFVIFIENTGSADDDYKLTVEVSEIPGAEVLFDVDDPDYIPILKDDIEEVRVTVTVPRSTAVGNYVVFVTAISLRGGMSVDRVVSLEVTEGPDDGNGDGDGGGPFGAGGTLNMPTLVLLVLVVVLALGMAMMSYMFRKKKRQVEELKDRRTVGLASMVDAELIFTPEGAAAPGAKLSLPGIPAGEVTIPQDRRLPVGGATPAYAPTPGVAGAVAKPGPPEAPDALWLPKVATGGADPMEAEEVEGGRGVDISGVESDSEGAKTAEPESPKVLKVPAPAPALGIKGPPSEPTLAPKPAKKGGIGPKSRPRPIPKSEKGIPSAKPGVLAPKEAVRKEKRKGSVVGTLPGEE